MATNHGAPGVLPAPQPQAQEDAQALHAGAGIEGGQVLVAQPDEAQAIAVMLQSAAAAAVPAVLDQIVQLLTDWVTGAAPQLGPGQDELTWFLSKRANVAINKWLASKKFAVLAPLSPAGTGCIVVSRVAVEHCRDHRALEGVGHTAVIELLGQLFVRGSPAYAPNTSKGKHGSGYPNQLAMFDATYTAHDPTAKGETPVGILQHEGAPFVHLKLVTAYWTKPGSASALRSDVLKK